MAKFDIQNTHPAIKALVWGWVLISLLTIAYHQYDGSLVDERISFHDRIVQRLDNFDRRYPKARPIMEMAKPCLVEGGYEFIRFSDDSPIISDYNKKFMFLWPHVRGLVSWYHKQVILRLNTFDLWSAALGIDFGILDITLLHEMVHVAYGKGEFAIPTMREAEEQLYLCLDESQRPIAWEIFEETLVEELVALLVSNSIIEGEFIKVPGPREIQNPQTYWEEQYVEWLDSYIPDCFSRGFNKSVIGWSVHITDEDTKILSQRVERFRCSEYLQSEVMIRLRSFGLP